MPQKNNVLNLSDEMLIYLGERAIATINALGKDSSEKHLRSRIKRLPEEEMPHEQEHFFRLPRKVQWILFESTLLYSYAHSGDYFMEEVGVHEIEVGAAYYNLEPDEIQDLFIAEQRAELYELANRDSDAWIEALKRFKSAIN